MTKLIIDELELLKNFDFQFRGKNEVYFRCVCWVGRDFTTAQYYPSKELIGAEFLSGKLEIIARKSKPVHFNDIGGIAIFNTNHSDVRTALQDFVAEYHKLLIKKVELESLESLLESLDGIHSAEGIKMCDKIHGVKVAIAQNEIKKESLKVPSQELLAAYDTLTTILSNYKDLNETILIEVEKIPPEQKLKYREKISIKKIEIITIENTMHKLALKINTYRKKPVVLSYVIQVLESDEKIRKFGSLLAGVNDLAKNMANPWIDLKNAEFNVELAKLKQAEKIEQGKDGFPVFDEATFLSPFAYHKAALDIFNAGITFVGTILAANQDDLIATFIKTKEISFGTSSEIDIPLAEPNKVNLKLKLIKNGGTNFENLPDGVKSLLDHYVGIETKTKEKSNDIYTPVLSKDLKWADIEVIFDND